MSDRQMSLTDDIKRCRTPQEALLLLAQAIDALNARLDAEPAEPADPWQQPLEWAAPVDPMPAASIAALAAAGNAAAAESHRRAAIEAVKAELATAVGEDADALRAKLRLLQDTGRSIEPAVPEGAPAKIASDGTTGVVELPTVADEERRQARRTWATQCKLHEFLPQFSAEEAAELFVKGGPMWLYLGNREAVMQMPLAWRQWLVDDIAKDSQAEAQRVGRDILKMTSSTDRAVTTQAIDALSASRGLR